MVWISINLIVCLKCLVLGKVHHRYVYIIKTAKKKNVGTTISVALNDFTQFWVRVMSVDQTCSQKTKKLGIQ